MLKGNKLLVFLLLGLFMISFTSAFEFDNVKNQKDITFDGKTIVGNKLLEKYKPIEIKNAFGWGRTQFEGYISEHDDSCGQFCTSTMEVKIGQDGSLIDNVIFKTLQEDGSWIEQNVRNYDFSYWGNVNEYESICETIGEYKNGTGIQECNSVKTGSHNGWVNYNIGDELKKGTYKVKLDAEKKPSRSVDWIIKTNGEWLESWATWGNISDGDDAEIILNSPSDNNISLTNQVTFNASANVTGGAYLTNMSLWTNESGTWEIKNTTNIGEYANDEFIKAYYRMEETAGVVVDDMNIYNGSTTFTSRGETGIIDNGFDFNGGNSRVETGIPYTRDNIVTLSFWFNGSTQTGVLMGRNKDAIAQRLININPSGNSNAISYARWSLIRGTSNVDAQVPYDDGEFHHIVIIENATTGAKIYYDGVLNASSATSFDYAGLSSSSFDFGTAWQVSDWYGSGFDGIIDELGIWNRTLNQAEITALYNSGNAARPPVATTLTETFTRTLTEPTLWNVEACDSDGDCGFSTSNFTVNIDTSAPTIEVESPNGTYDYNYVGGNVTLNITATDTNLESCWYDYNGTNITIDGCLTGVKNSTNFILEEGNLNMTIYINDSVGNINSEFVSWSYKVSQNSFIFENETRAGDQEDFKLNLTLGTGYDLSSAVFHYNGYNETPSIISSGQNRILALTDYTVPLYVVTTNATIYFSLVLDDATEINTSNQTQLVNAIFLDNCSSYTNQLFNISLFDEEAKTPINGDIEFNYNLLNKPAYETINTLNLNFDNVSNAQICSDINLSNQNYAQTVEIRYSSDGYAKELYNIQKADIGANATQLELFDLNTNDSTEFLIKYQDDTLTTVEGAVIQLMRKYISEDAYEIVEAPTTSSIGTAIVHIDLNTNLYKVIVVKDGIVLDIFTSLVFDCENELSGVCEQNLFGSIDPQNSVSVENLNDFSFAVTSVNNTITTTFSIPSGTPASVNIFLKQKDMFGNSYLCNKTITSSAGSIDCDYNDTIGDSIVSLSITKDGEQQVYRSYNIAEAGSIDWLGNNFLIVFILLLSLAGMAIASPEWMIINSVGTMVLCGGIWLLSGVDFVAGFGTLFWLLISAVILIFKISKQEDR